MTDSSPAFETPTRENLLAPRRAIQPLHSHQVSGVSKYSNAYSPALPPLVRTGSPSCSSTAQSKSSSQASLHLSPPIDYRQDPLNVGNNDAETEDAIQHREDADALNEIIMAIEYKSKGSVGCAYYVAREEKLYMMQDIQLSSFDILESLKLRAQPTDILISTRAEDSLEKFARLEATNCDKSDGGDSELP